MRWLGWALGMVSLVAVPAEATAAEPSSYSTEYHSRVGHAGGDDDKRIACVKAETVRQDATLNVAYSRLMGRLSAYQKQQLRLSERAWIEYRDAECNFQSSINIGGPAGIVARAQSDAHDECLLRETALRAEALKASYGSSWDGTT